jgi:hypothetical protein
MDNLSGKLRVFFDNLRLDPSFNPFEESWQIELGIVGDFVIRVNDKILYKEVGFCLVEFAVQISRWLKKDQLNKDFIYVTAESEEIGIVWIKYCENKWRVGSVHQEYEELSLFESEEIRRALQKYIEDLINSLPRRFREKVLRMI